MPSAAPHADGSPGLEASGAHGAHSRRRGPSNRSSVARGDAVAEQRIHQVLAGFRGASPSPARAPPAWTRRCHAHHPRSRRPDGHRASWRVARSAPRPACRRDRSLTHSRPWSMALRIRCPAVFQKAPASGWQAHAGGVHADADVLALHRIASADACSPSRDSRCFTGSSVHRRAISCSSSCGWRARSRPAGAGTPPLRSPAGRSLRRHPVDAAASRRCSRPPRNRQRSTSARVAVSSRLPSSSWQTPTTLGRLKTLQLPFSVCRLRLTSTGSCRLPLPEDARPAAAIAAEIQQALPVPDLPLEQADQLSLLLRRSLLIDAP